jgi:hypothetical protein
LKPVIALLVLELPDPETFGLIVATSNASGASEGSRGDTGALGGIA